MGEGLGVGMAKGRRGLGLEMMAQGVISGSGLLAAIGEGRLQVHREVGAFEGPVEFGKVLLVLGQMCFGKKRKKLDSLGLGNG